MPAYTGSDIRDEMKEYMKIPNNIRIVIRDVLSSEGEASHDSVGPGKNMKRTEKALRSDVKKMVTSANMNGLFRSVSLGISRKNFRGVTATSLTMMHQFFRYPVIEDIFKCICF